MSISILIHVLKSIAHAQSQHTVRINGQITELIARAVSQSRIELCKFRSTLKIPI